MVSMLTMFLFVSFPMTILSRLVDAFHRFRCANSSRATCFLDRTATWPFSVFRCKVIVLLADQPAVVQMINDLKIESNLILRPATSKMSFDVLHSFPPIRHSIAMIFEDAIITEDATDQWRRVETTKVRTMMRYPLLHLSRRELYLTANVKKLTWQAILRSRLTSLF